MIYRYTNKLTAKGEKCFCPTNQLIWKDPKDVNFCVRSRSQEKKKKVTNSQWQQYFKRKRIELWVDSSRNGSKNFGSELEILISEDN